MYNVVNIVVSTIALIFCVVVLHINFCTLIFYIIIMFTSCDYNCIVICGMRAHACRSKICMIYILYIYIYIYMLMLMFIAKVDLAIKSVCMHVRLCVCMYACMCVCVCMRTCMC